MSLILFRIVLLLACAVAGMILLDVAYASASGAGSIAMAGWRLVPRFYALLASLVLTGQLARLTGGRRFRPYVPGEFIDPDRLPPVYAPTRLGRWFALRHADTQEALGTMDFGPLAFFARAYGVDLIDLQRDALRSAVRERAEMSGASWAELDAIDRRGLS